VSVRAIAVLAPPLLVSGCLIAVGPNVDGLVDRVESAPDSVRFVYMGSGGWLIEHGDVVVMSAPLFTNPGLLDAGVFKIHSDTVVVDRHMAYYDSLYDVSRAAAIVSGHGHYDHLMDVPRVARRYAPDAKLVLNRTSAHILGTWAGVQDRVEVVNGREGNQERLGEWLRFGDGLRIMAVRSHHAAHFDGYTLYRGFVDEPKAEEPTWASEWLEGQSFSYIIDFLAGPDSVAFRVYYQDAVSPAPSGFAPDALIRERPVDVAILVPSTFDQVEWHPEAFIENLRPRYVLLGHWEDFFRPFDDDTKSLRVSDLGHFEHRLDRVFDGEWWRPEKRTEFRFPVR
jgi:hypothetical protein